MRRSCKCMQHARRGKNVHEKGAGEKKSLRERLKTYLPIKKYLVAKIRVLERRLAMSFVMINHFFLEVLVEDI